jgi:alkylhydroperoxidase/carboxymuconolactone decarboxylase family protein YurZ
MPWPASLTLFANSWAPAFAGATNQTTTTTHPGGRTLTDPVKESMNDPHAWSRTWEDGDEPPILKEMLATGIIRRKWQEVLAEFQPQVLSLWNERRLKWKPRELDPKTREFITIALGMVSGSHHIANHFNSAFEKGATVQELVDVCVVTGHLTGAQSWDIGLASLDSVIELRAKTGLSVPRDKSEL